MDKTTEKIIIAVEDINIELYDKIVELDLPFKNLECFFELTYSSNGIEEVVTLFNVPIWNSMDEGYFVDNEDGSDYVEIENWYQYLLGKMKILLSSMADVKL